MSDRLTDERVREIAETYLGAAPICLRDSDGENVDITEAEIEALAREVLAARAGDREEREGAHRIESVRWSRANDEEIEGNVYGEPVTLLVVKGHVGPLGWDDAVRVTRAAPGGETRKEANDGSL